MNTTTMDVNKTNTRYEYDKNNRLTSEYESETRFLSDMEWVSATNGYGPVERDMSNGETAAGDGKLITLNGVTYEKGLGVHANSEIVYNLGRQYSRFISDIGIDDEVGDGYLKFLVYLDGEVAYDSGYMNATSITQTINISVEGKTELKLVVDSAGANSYDHADWAGARLRYATVPSEITTYTYDGNGNQKSKKVMVQEKAYLSDLEWVSATNGHGPVEKDMSSGESLAGDGRAMKLNGVLYEKGLGVHANSEIVYNLGGNYSRFISDIGIDDEVTIDGCVEFFVYGDGRLLYDSGEVNYDAATKSIDVSVGGVQKLKLVVDCLGSLYSDHADWAGARVVKAATSSVISYEYDGFNQLTKVNDGGNVYTYTYGGDGLRLSKTVNGVKTTHVWDGQQIVAELNSSGTVTSKYIRGINPIYVQDSAGTKKFYLFNGHGDVVGLTNTSGNVIKTYYYDPFGVEKSPVSSDVNPFRYCGEYFDKETGTIYLRARYYNPSVGRFITEDSYIGKVNDPLSLNLYTYCFNNPVNFRDPFGHAGTPIFEGKIDMSKVGNMTKSDIIKDLPNGWKYTENNGFLHIRDQNGMIRMRIDPPDKVTNYDHVHFYNQNGESLDKNLNVVDKKSKDAHIKYKGPGDDDPSGGASSNGKTPDINSQGYKGVQGNLIVDDGGNIWSEYDAIVGQYYYDTKKVIYYDNFYNINTPIVTPVKPATGFKFEFNFRFNISFWKLFPAW